MFLICLNLLQYLDENPTKNRMSQTFVTNCIYNINEARLYFRYIPIKTLEFSVSILITISNKDKLFNVLCKSGARDTRKLLVI